MASSNGSVGDAIAEMLTGLVRCAGLPTRLSELGIDRAALPQLAEDATQQWTGRFNPVALDAGGFLELYENAF
jgi:alcohol dehydrogenase